MVLEIGVALMNPRFCWNSNGWHLWFRTKWCFHHITIVIPRHGPQGVLSLSERMAMRWSIDSWSNFGAKHRAYFTCPITVCHSSQETFISCKYIIMFDDYYHYNLNLQSIAVNGQCCKSIIWHFSLQSTKGLLWIQEQV